MLIFKVGIIPHIRFVCDAYGFSFFFFKEEVFLSGVCRDHTSFIFSCAKIINYV